MDAEEQHEDGTHAPDPVGSFLDKALESDTRWSAASFFASVLARSGEIEWHAEILGIDDEEAAALDTSDDLDAVEEALWDCLPGKLGEIDYLLADESWDVFSTSSDDFAVMTAGSILVRAVRFDDRVFYYSSGDDCDDEIWFAYRVGDKAARGDAIRSLMKEYGGLVPGAWYADAEEFADDLRRVT